MSIREIDNSRKRCEFCGVIVLDVNNLKKFNDNYGHSMGDKFIIEASYAIDISCRGIGIPYRIGGDEFYIIVENEKDVLDTIGKIISNFQEKLAELNNRLNWPTPISIAYGYSVYSQGDTMSSIAERADKRMYEMKKKMKAHANDEKILDDERH